MGNRILVIEDRQILRDLLGRAGYEMIEAETGEAGGAAAISEWPDLILTVCSRGSTSIEATTSASDVHEFEVGTFRPNVSAGRTMSWNATILEIVRQFDRKQH
jgi:hypothetical protein